jgi:hypothetical protein
MPSHADEVMRRQEMHEHRVEMALMKKEREAAAAAAAAARASTDQQQQQQATPALGAEVTKLTKE